MFLLNHLSFVSFPHHTLGQQTAGHQAQELSPSCTLRPPPPLPTPPPHASTRDRMAPCGGCGPASEISSTPPGESSASARSLEGRYLDTLYLSPGGGVLPAYRGPRPGSLLNLPCIGDSQHNSLALNVNSPGIEKPCRRARVVACPSVPFPPSHPPWVPHGPG